MVAWKPYTRSLLEIIVTSLSNLFYPGSQRIIDPIGDPLDTDGVLLFHPGHDQPWANFGKGGMHRPPPPPMRTPKARSLEGGGGSWGPHQIIYLFISMYLNLIIYYVFIYYYILFVILYFIFVIFYICLYFIN